MTQQEDSCPLSRAQVVDLYFMEHRAKLIDIAAFLDRLDRARADVAGDAGPAEDFRIAQLKQAVAILTDGQRQRAKRVLDLFSDPTTEPLASAAGMKGAFGAWPGAGK